MYLTLFFTLIVYLCPIIFSPLPTCFTGLLSCRGGKNVKSVLSCIGGAAPGTGEFIDGVMTLRPTRGDSPILLDGVGLSILAEPARLGTGSADCGVMIRRFGIGDRALSRIRFEGDGRRGVVRNG